MLQLAATPGMNPQSLAGRGFPGSATRATALHHSFKTFSVLRHAATCCAPILSHYLSPNTS